MILLTKRKQKRFSKLIILFIILLNTCFTVSVLYVFLRTGTEPVTLIGAFFGFTTVELWNLTRIKTTEIKKEAPKND